MRGSGGVSGPRDTIRTRKSIAFTAEAGNARTPITTSRKTPSFEVEACNCLAATSISAETSLEGDLEKTPMGFSLNNQQRVAMPLHVNN
jgi:hypothetical protein